MENSRINAGVCPKCGAEVVNTMIMTQPPFLVRKCSQCNWAVEEKVEVRDIWWPDSAYAFGAENIPECCRNCSGHPKNGGSGMCMCTLPYLH